MISSIYSLVCNKAEFKCKKGSCISIIKKCDGIADCSEDQSDEEDCPTRSVCSPIDNCATDSKCLQCIEEPGPILKFISQCGKKKIDGDCNTDNDCCTGYCHMGEKLCQQRGKFEIIFVICAT